MDRTKHICETSCFEYKINGHDLIRYINRDLLEIRRYATLLRPSSPKYVMHTCNNSRCIFPEHLKVITKEEYDKYIKEFSIGYWFKMSPASKKTRIIDQISNRVLVVLFIVVGVIVMYRFFN